MLVTSRSYPEYVAMFGLDESALTGLRILDCSAGASGFTAEAAARGVPAYAVDPAYAMGRERLADAARESLVSGNAIAGQFEDRFTYRWYGDPSGRDVMRKQALARFLLDLSTHPSRYVAAALPALPFRERAFDVALCSHLLFTWADQLGHTWHLAALVELVRVATEVRVFPTVLQGAGDPVPFWDDLMSDLDDAGIRTELRQVPYEFQVGADRMLVLTRR